MKRLVLAVAVLSLFLAGALARAEEPLKKEAPAAAAAAKEIVFDGAEIGASAKSWAQGGTAGKVTGAAQDKEVRTAGRKTVEFHGEGSGWMGIGWNWFGWWPQDGGTDISRYTTLRFWAKVSGDKKPPQLTALLTSNDKKATQPADLLKYCPELLDGKWHEVVIPIQDMDTKGELNKAKVWEILFGAWTQDAVNFNLYVDEIAFGGASGAAAPAAPASSGPAAALPTEVAATDPGIRYIGRWDMTDPKAPRAAWTASTVMARFKGTAVNARMLYTGTYPDSFYQIAVDGRPTRVLELKKGQELYEVARGLSDGEHTVEIVRRNEAAWSAPCVFAGFQLEKEGKLLAAAAAEREAPAHHRRLDLVRLRERGPARRGEPPGQGERVPELRRRGRAATRGRGPDRGVVRAEAQPQ